MASAYAALVSLSHILHQILHLPPTHHFIIIPIKLIESLQEEVIGLINFLEKHSSSQELEDLPEEKRIVDAAHEAEDIIESDVVNQIHRAKMSSTEEIQVPIPIQMDQGVLKVTEEFVSIRTVLAETKDSHGMKEISSWSRPLPCGSDIMVGFDECFNQIREILASGALDLQIVPIVGMGGAGKTTIATNVFKDRIVEMFDVCALVSVSEEYTLEEIILALLQQINSLTEYTGNADELGVLLHKQLFCRRYFIVLDDMWDAKAWDTLKMYLPNTSDGSRILVTTRQMNLAKEITSCSPYEMRPLNEEHSWNLIREKAFGKEKTCPSELEKIGRSIARRCGGLPLGLVVIGGLLAKSEKTKEFWEYVEENVSSAANSENDEHCLKILSLSYRKLPLHLKPCFLYLAVFPKTFDIHTSRLIRLWVAEGFIKQGSSNGSLEEVAEGYFKDLMDRNLIIVGKRGHTGHVKNFRVHDLIWDLCMREAHKNKFLCIAKLNIHNISTQLESEHRISIHTGTKQDMVLSLTTLNRSFSNYAAAACQSRCVADRLDLLRVLNTVDSYSINEILCLINSRYISCAVNGDQLLHIPSLISMLSNLQTLVLPTTISLPSEIWLMPQLRHLKMRRIILPDVNVEREDIIVLEHLQTLSTVKDFIFREQILERIPNLKKLGIEYYTTEKMGYFCLRNLVSLNKLESLVLAFRGTWENMDFPKSLKKLTVSHCEIPWEDMYMVGSLPNLEVLKLKARAAKGRMWNPNVGEFCSLKSLMISWCDLEIWAADDTHFPCLEKLQLTGIRMEEIPMDFAQMASLQIIELNHCSRSLSASAKRMSNERERLGYEDVQIRSFHSKDAAVESLLENLTMLMNHRPDLIEGVKDQMEKLFRFLQLLICGGVESTDLGDIRGIVNDIEDAVDAFITLKQAARSTTKNYFRRAEKGMPDIAKIVESLLKKIDDIQGDMNRFADFANLNAHDGEFHEYDEAREMRESTVVGFEDEVEKLKGYISEESQQLNVIPIIGMPGLGKTTLAGMIFNDPQIQVEFPTRIWVHVSREFTMKHVSHTILKELTLQTRDIESKTNEELAKSIVSYLENRKFLLVMDDIWSCEDWDELRILLPESNKQGKVLITSRHTEVGWHVSLQRGPHMLRFLTPDESYLLLQMEVFRKPEFPPELECEGWLIAEICGGLPLAIVVIAGTLKRFSSDITAMKINWENLTKSFDTYHDDEDPQKCMEKVLLLSCEKLPDHLRDCFLYFGMFPDGFEIPVKKLVRIWIAEGFIRQKEFLSLEDIAENYLEQLVDRNLVRAEKLKSNGKVKTCRIHSILRDFCLNEVEIQGEGFLQEIKMSSNGGFQPPIDEELKFRRLSIHSDVLNFVSMKPSGPSVRSFVCMAKDEMTIREDNSAIPKGFKQLRVLDVEPIKFTKNTWYMYELFHLRYLALSINSKQIPSTFSKLWNIQTLIINTDSRTLKIKADILRMTQLRHFETNASATLPKTSKGSNKGAGEKIQTLETISPESCTEDVFCRAYNLKKLGARGNLNMLLDEKSGSFDSLGKLGSLEKLKLVNDTYHLSQSEVQLCGLPPAYKFPPKLKILTLAATRLSWHHMSIIGLLDKLEVLKLKDEAFLGEIWEVTDGGFRVLQVLEIGRTNLKFWLASEHHFPMLKHLQLNNCEDLQQVPIELADVPSFRKLDLFHSERAAASAKKIEAKIKNNLQTGNAVCHLFRLSIFPHEK